MHAKLNLGVFAWKIYFSLLFFGFFTFAFLVTPSKALAANLYWVGANGAATNVNTNWKTTDPASCGGGDAGAAPGGSDVAIFDSDCDNNAAVTGSFSVQGVTMQSGYAGTVSQNAIAMTIGSSGWDQQGGTFTGNSDGSTANMTFSGNLSLSGGTFTSTNDTLTLSNVDLTVTSATFTHNSGTVTFNTNHAGSNTYTGTITFYNLNIGTLNDEAETYIVASGSVLTVNNTLTLGDSGTFFAAYLQGDGEIHAKKDITVAATGLAISSGNNKIVVDGTGDQVITGTSTGDLPNVEINKSTGNLTISGTITVGGNFTVTSLGSGSLTTSGSTVIFDTCHTCSKTFSGSITLNNVTIGGAGFESETYTVSSGTTITVAGTLSFPGGAGGGRTLNGPGAIYAQGNITTANNSVGGDLAITLTGSGNQTITDTAGALPTGTFTINKSGGTATLGAALNLSASGQDLVIANGTLDTSTYNLTVNDVFTLSGTLTQGTGNVTAATYSITKSGIWRNPSTGDMVVGSGGVSNAGLMQFGTPESCGASDSVTITSSDSSTDRTWTGNGSADFYDVAVSDQMETPKKGSVNVFSGTQTRDSNFNFNANCPRPASLYWKLDDNQGSSTQDSSVNNLDGTLNNSPTWQNANMCLNGACLYMNGTSNQNVSLADNANLDFTSTDSFTVQAWVKRNGASSAVNYILSKADTTTGGYKLWMDADGDACFGIDDDAAWGPDISACSTNANFDDDKWHFVSGVRDVAGDTVKVYVDGKIYDSQTDPTTTTLANGNTFYAGVDRDGTSNEWLGFIDEVKVYSYARSSAQVRADYLARGIDPGATNVLGSSTRNLPGALSDGLVGYWKMDETSWATNCSTASVLDYSGNGLNAAPCNNAASALITNGKFGPGGDLDGVNDYVNIPDNAAFDLSPTGKYTWAFWINPDDFEEWNAVWFQGNTPTDELAIVAHDSASADWDVTHGIAVGYCTNNCAERVAMQSEDNVLAVGTWSHVVVTFDGTQTTAANKISIYVNGIDRTDRTDTSGILGTVNSVSSATAYIGYEDVAGENFDGKIDEVRYYTRALSPLEASQLSKWGPGPVGYWNFDEGSGTNATDLSGNANNGTITAGTGGYTPGKYGGAYNFDAANTIINAGSGSSLDELAAGPMSIEAWIYPKSCGEGNVAGYIAAKSTATTQTAGWIFACVNAFGPTNALQFAIDGSTDFVRTSANSAITMNTWQHVALVWDGVFTTASSAKLYINGVETGYGSTTNGVSRVSDASTPLYLGNSPALDRTFDGKIDELKIYNYQRTKSQILEDMNAGHPAPGSPVGTPYGNWRFDEGATNLCSGGTNDACNAGNGGTALDGAIGGATNPTYTNAGKFGKALTFGGSGGYVNIPAFSATTGASQISWSMWVKPNSLGTNECIFCMANNLVSGVSRAVTWAIIEGSTDSSKVKVLISNSADKTSVANYGETPTGTLVSGTWTHIGVVYDGTQVDNASRLVIYINGKKQTLTFNGTITATTQTADASVTANIGSDSADNASFYSGDMDEVRLYNEALTEEQMKLDMNRGASQVLGALSSSSNANPQSAASEYCPPDSSATICTGPTHEYKFDEATGSTSNDTGTGTTARNLTLTNTPVFANGKYNKGMSFTATNQYLTPGAVELYDETAAFTVSAWVYIRNLTIDPFIIGDDNNSNTVFYISSSFNGRTNAVHYCFDADCQPLGTGDAASSNNVITTGGWYHVAMSYDGTNVCKFYVNGKDVSAGDTCGEASAGYQTTVGGNNSGSTGNDVLDQVRIYNYVRTPAQIAWEYNGGGPLAWWKMDECQGTTINDASGNGYSGTLTVGGTGSYTSAGTCGSGTSTHAWFNGVAGKKNYSIALDGTNDYIQVTHNSIFDFGSTDFSLSAWVKFNNITTEIIMEKFTESTGPGWSWYQNAGLEFFGCNNATCITKAYTFTTGQWYFITLTKNGSTYTEYVNGISLGSTTNANALTSSGNPITIGERDPSNAGQVIPFNGQIDDVKIFKYPLSATQVQLLYNDGGVSYQPTTGAP